MADPGDRATADQIEALIHQWHGEDRQAEARLQRTPTAFAGQRTTAELAARLAAVQQAEGADRDQRRHLQLVGAG